MNETERKFWAYCEGYGSAVRGAGKAFRPQLRIEFPKDWDEGFEDAVNDGKFGTHPDYQSK